MNKQKAHSKKRQIFRRRGYQFDFLLAGTCSNQHEVTLAECK